MERITQLTQTIAKIVDQMQRHEDQHGHDVEWRHLERNLIKLQDKRAKLEDELYA